MLKQRVITATILAIVFLAAVFLLPAYAWAILVVLLVGQGALEWARLARMPAVTAVFYAVISMLLLGSSIWWRAAEHLDLFWYGLSAGLWLTIVPGWLFAGWRFQNIPVLALIGWAVLVPTGLAMVALHNAGPWWLLGIMSTVWLADIAAYFSGRRFGKHKLAPNISPGKTWEGAAGAVVLVSLYVLAIVWAAALGGTAPRWYFLLPAIWLWVALSIMGDLFESAVKRQAGVKDSGTLLPGHGGLLDRIDALTSTLPFAAAWLLLEHGA